jgi:hypothetical protein
MMREIGYMFSIQNVMIIRNIQSHSQNKCLYLSKKFTNFITCDSENKQKIYLNQCIINMLLLYNHYRQIVLAITFPKY